MVRLEEQQHCYRSFLVLSYDQHLEDLGLHAGKWLLTLVPSTRERAGVSSEGMHLDVPAWARSHCFLDLARFLGTERDVSRT